MSDVFKLGMIIFAGMVLFSLVGMMLIAVIAVEIELWKMRRKVKKEIRDL